MYYIVNKICWGGHGLHNFSKSLDFGNFKASSENYQTFAVSKDKGFGFYRKIIELAPLLYRYHDTPENMWNNWPIGS